MKINHPITTNSITKGNDLPIEIKMEKNISPHHAQPDIQQVLGTLGVDSSPELKEAVKLLLDQKIALNRELLQQLKLFLVQAEGNLQQKLDTLKTLINKALEINLAHLVSVHEALHGKGLSELFMKIFTSSQGQEKGIMPLEFISHKSDPIQQAQHQDLFAYIKEQINSEKSLSPALNKIDVYLSRNQQESPELIKRFITLIQSGQNVLRFGNESEAKEFISSSLQNIEETHRIQETVKRNADEVYEQIKRNQEYVTNETYQTTVPFNAKDLVVTKVTRKLSEINQQFRNLKQEIIRHLEPIIRNMPKSFHPANPQIQNRLEKTIDLLDKAILKSEITLYTDMQTEKELIKASSLLTEAKKLANKGSVEEAVRIVQRVQFQLETLQWKASDVKIKHLIVQEFDAQNHASPESKELSRILRGVKDTIEQRVNIQQSEPSARNLYEMFRAVGLNYESEAAQVMTLKPEHLDQEEIRKNMKAVLLQLVNGDEEQLKQATKGMPVEQVLNNITGQQLLSKSDTGSPMQSMFFNLPLLFGKQAENVKIYINAKKDGQKIDWENCSLYFLLETKNLGETGILISATDRKLTITVKNDQPWFKEMMEPLVDKYKSHLQELGYTIAGIHFTKLKLENTDTLKPTNDSQSNSPSYFNLSKGLDLKI